MEKINEREDRMQQSIDLKEYLNIFKKRGWIIVILVMIALFISAVFNFFLIKPIYQAELTFMVNFNPNENAQVTKEDMEYGQNLVEKYKPIVQSRKVTETIKNNLNLNMTQSQIGQSIQISSISGPVMMVTVQNTNPQIATDIANQVPEVFGSELKRIAKVDGIEVIDDAIKPTSPISPNKINNMMKATIIAIVIAIFIIFLLEYLDNKVKTVEDIEKTIGVPVLGIISEFEITQNKKSFGKKKRKKKKNKKNKKNKAEA